ncbi:NAD(P)/FAD-dependent oxidoreductase [Pseudonocardia zijingensis]|jgi:3-phenylpropionate/trans-cinnamate dioxygenase ferredoxin reductase subunit|uniref:FAD/NAD(P)-binding oxidoreductase n=1 Tax=Pseudonocardia zijingensis TaxID=153376 RepID=A0ABN1NAN5_9PSEU
MTGQPEHVVIVGAGLGGLRTAQQLRSAGLQGRISIVGAETHLPYDRPPLSKQVLTGEWEPERTALAGTDTFEELGVRAHLGNPAVALRPGHRDHELELADGAALHADAVVVATGLVARELPGQPAQVHTLRTLDDALALRGALDSARTLLVVGAGFIGAEVASSARTRGTAVTAVEALEAPSVRALGPRLGPLAARLITESGVELHTGATITRFVESPDSADGVEVELADGRRLAADVAVVGIGGVPRLEWLADTGLDTARGIACGPTGRVHGLDGVWAVGDVAAWDDPVSGARHRHEHWTSAGDQAAVVARDVLGAPPPPATVPYCWSDQFGLKIQIIGRPELAEDVVALHGAGLDNGGPVRGTVVGYVAGDRLVAVAGFGAARYVARYRPLVGAGAPLGEVRATAEALG